MEEELANCMLSAIMLDKHLPGQPNDEAKAHCRLPRSLSLSHSRRDMALSMHLGTRINTHIHTHTYSRPNWGPLLLVYSSACLPNTDFSSALSPRLDVSLRPRLRLHLLLLLLPIRFADAGRVGGTCYNNRVSWWLWR